MTLVKKAWLNSSAQFTTLRRSIHIMHIKRDTDPSKNSVYSGRDAQTLVMLHVIVPLLTPRNLKRTKK